LLLGISTKGTRYISIKQVKLIIFTVVTRFIIQSILTVILACLLFEANAQVVITGINPTNGPIGSTVTITGSNFDNSPANNIVWFGATKATVASASSTGLTVTVPAGASFSPISVLNTQTHLSARSAKSFLPTYSPNTGSITVADFLTAMENQI
jgi:hypothetical protein